MNASSEAAAGMKAAEAGFDLETIFRAQYERIARVIARVVRDPARAEELAVEVFLKLWRNRRAQGEKAEGWLYRSAVRIALDELRRETRRNRYERLLGFIRRAATPEEIHATTEERERVRRVLAAISPRQAEILLLRGHGLSYGEVASALDLNPASVGTFLSRARSRRSGRSTSSDMENKMYNGHWVDERLAELSTGGEWEPDLAAGLVCLRKRRDARSRRSWILAAVALVTACLCLMALPAPRAAAQLFWQTFTTPLPKMAPDFTLDDADGNPVRLSSFRGKVVLLNFWATWCGGCKTEIPWFIDFQRTYGERGLAVLGVSFDDDGWKSVKPYMDAKKINYRVMIGNDMIAALYGGFKSLPATLLLDRSGRIAAAHVGVVSESKYRAEIEKLLNAKAPAGYSKRPSSADGP